MVLSQCPHKYGLKAQLLYQLNVPRYSDGIKSMYLGTMMTLNQYTEYFEWSNTSTIIWTALLSGFAMFRTILLPRSKLTFWHCDVKRLNYNFLSVNFFNQNVPKSDLITSHWDEVDKKFTFWDISRDKKWFWSDLCSNF